RFGLVRVALGQRVAVLGELLQRRLLVAGVDQQQQLPDQRLGRVVAIRVDARVGLQAVGEVVVGVEFGVVGVHRRVPQGGRANRDTAGGASNVMSLVTATQRIRARRRARQQQHAFAAIASERSGTFELVARLV